MLTPRSLFSKFAGRRSIGVLAVLIATLAIAIPVFAAISTNDGAVTTLTITKPTGTAENDVLLANIVFRGDTGATISAPGWTLIAKRTNTNAANATERLTQATYRKVAGSSEPAGYDFTFAGTTNVAGGIVNYSGIDTANPLDASATNPASDTSVAAATPTLAPSVDPSEANTRIVSMWAYDTDTTFTKPSDMTLVFDRAKNSGNGTTSRVRAAAADMVQASDAATGTKSATPGAAVRYVAQTVALNQKESQTITFDQPTTPRTFGDTFNVNPTASSGLAVTVNASGGCAAAPGTTGYDVEMTSGTTACVLTASQPGNSSWLAASNVQRTVVAQKQAQAITFDQPTSPRTFGDEFNVNPTSDSGLNVSVNASGGCSAGPGTTGFDVEITSGTSDCVLTASQAGNANYAAATEVQRTVETDKANQTITFTQPTSPRGFGETFNVNPTSSSGLAVTVSSPSDDGCSVAAGTTGYDVTMTSPTLDCVLTASQAGNDNYNAALEVQRTVAAQKGSQTITFTQPTSPRTFGDTFNVDPTSSSGLDVTVGASGGCTVEPGATDGWDVTMTSGTTACVLTASHAGNDNYNAASNVQRTVNAQKANQTITFDDAPASATFGDTFNVNPTAPAGAVTVTSPNNDGCSVAAGATSGWDVTMTDGTKDCELTASRAGNDNYNAAANVLRTVTAEKADQTITFAQPTSPQTYGGTFTVAPTASSGHTVVVTSAVDDGCSVSGFDVTMTSGIADCVLTASQPGNTDYNPAPDVQRTVNAAKKQVTVDMETAPAPGAGNKVYDGNSSAVVDFTGATLVDVLPADTDVTLDATGYSASFADKNVGTDKVVTVAGLTAMDAGSGAAANYTVVQPAYSATGPENENLLADITAKHVTGSFTAANKVYDGNTAASIASQTLAGEVSGDDVDLTGTPTFATKTVGNGKTVTLGSPSLAGADKDNYILDSVGTTTANVTAKSVTGSFTAADKVYDGGTSASASDRTLSGAVAGDTVSLTGGTATFADRNVGNGKTVTLAGASLAGADAGNYTLGSVATDTANITAKSVTGSFTAADKDFDGTTAATITGRSLSGAITGDLVALASGTAAFNDPNPGVSKPVTGSGFALSGAHSGNYTLASVSNTTATIRQRGPAPSETPTEEELEQGASQKLGGAVKSAGLDFGDLAFAFAPKGQGKSIPASNQALFAIGCPADCDVTAGKTVVLTGDAGASAAATKKLKLKTQRMTLDSGEIGVIKLKLTKKQKRAIKRANKAKLVVKVTVVSGGETVTDKKAYRLRAR